MKINEVIKPTNKMINAENKLLTFQWLLFGTKSTAFDLDEDKLKKLIIVTVLRNHLIKYPCGIRVAESRKAPFEFIETNEAVQNFFKTISKEEILAKYELIQMSGMNYRLKEGCKLTLEEHEEYKKVSAPVVFVGFSEPVPIFSVRKKNSNGKLILGANPKKPVFVKTEEIVNKDNLISVDQIIVKNRKSCDALDDALEVLKFIQLKCNRAKNKYNLGFFALTTETGATEKFGRKRIDKTYKYIRNVLGITNTNGLYCSQNGKGIVFTKNNVKNIFLALRDLKLKMAS